MTPQPEHTKTTAGQMCVVFYCAECAPPGASSFKDTGDFIQIVCFDCVPENFEHFHDNSGAQSDSGMRFYCQHIGAKLELA